MSPNTSISIPFFTAFLTVINCLDLWDKVDFSVCNHLDYTSYPVGASLKTVLANKQHATWEKLREECSRQYPGYKLLSHDLAKLNEAEKSLCGGGVVPLGVEKQGNYEIKYRKYEYWSQYKHVVDSSVLQLQNKRFDNLTNTKHRLGAFNLTSTTWWLDDEDTEYNCAVCQRSPIDFSWITKYRAPPKYFEEAKAIVYKVGMVGDDNTFLPKDMAEELGVRFNVNVSGIHRFAHAQYHLITSNQIICPEKHVGEVVNGYQLFALERVDRCYEEEMPNRFTNGTFEWIETRINSVDEIYFDDPRVWYASRECYYNVSIGKAVWSDVSYWDQPKKRCTGPLKEEQMSKIHSWLLEANSQNITLDASLLCDIMLTANLLLRWSVLGDYQKLTELFDIYLDMGIVMTKTEFKNEEIFECDGFLINSIGADTLNQQFVGFTFNPITVSESELKFIGADENVNTSQEARITLRISKALETSKLIFDVKQADIRKIDDLTDKRIKFTIMDVLLQCIITPIPNNIDKLSKKDLYFDIYLYSGRILLWNQKDKSFSNKTCVKTSSRNSFTNIYRCSLKYVTNHLGGIYYISYDYELLKSTSDLIKSSMWYLIPLIIEGILSLIGLISIALTTIFIKKWRQELGNKVLLHMTSSLTINLILSFLINFADENTRTDPLHCNFSLNACMYLGIARHYSYLTMFMWMLVLSLLQVKRIMTILGSSNHSNLLLKISAFAWGFPLLPVITLVALNNDFYRPDKRGFCYPEGLPFKITTQGPAASVLVVNAVIFIMIIARIFEWCGWGKIKGLQRHGLKEDTLLIRRLLASFCVFILFGLMWTFHWLAEEGVFSDDVLFEYLFLITATTHIVMLSMFFVFMDRDAMAEWKNRLIK